ncbi:MAG: isopentenyl-diphosphate Delta-isomerase [Bacteroidales bacterium]
MEQVVLVDENDVETGRMEKIEAHVKGVLHRAFSVFIVNSSGQLLLQRRSKEKYHSPGLLTNTCCSHPRPDEPVEKAALRRLMEEMGLKCILHRSFSFIYRFEFDNGLTEHEYDHVLLGMCNDVPVPDPEEVSEYKYADIEILEDDIRKNPENYTVWFRIAYPMVKEKLNGFIKDHK